MATLGAELGCERYLASTVVTGSGQRSGAFLTKLRRNNVFVLALRAFHCRPRRKKRARCTARVTSHMIGDKADTLHEICPPDTRDVGQRISLSRMSAAKTRCASPVTRSSASTAASACFG